MLIETLAFDKLHRVENAAIGESADVMNWNDAGMFELREDAGFTQKSMGEIACRISPIPG